MTDEDCEEADTEPRIPLVEMNADNSFCAKGWLDKLELMYAL